MDNRRARTLTDEDLAAIKLEIREITTAELEKIWQRLDQAQTKHLEAIGYDVSTPEARAAIYADHGWVRTMRVGGSRTMKAGLAALGMAALFGIFRFLGDLLNLGLQVTLKAKGGG